MKKKIMMLLILSLAVGLSACGSVSNEEAAMLFDSFDSEPEYEMRLEEGEVGQRQLRANAPSSLPENTTNTTIAADRVIHSASTGIVVDDFDRGVEQVQELTADFDGFIQQSHITGESSSSLGRVGDFTIRIPAQSYNEMLEMLTDLGELNFLNTTAVNVSDQYADIVSRLNSLRTQEDRVLELVESAEDLADLLLLEERLGELIYEIELLTGERNYLDNQISYSTVDIRISERVEAFSSGGLNSQTLGNIFMTSFRAMGVFGGTMIRVFIALIPWSIPASILFLIIKKIRRRKKGIADDVEKKQRVRKRKSTN